MARPSNRGFCVKIFVLLCAALLLPTSSFVQNQTAQDQTAREAELLEWIHDGYASPLPADSDALSSLAWQLAQLVPDTHGIHSKRPLDPAIRLNAIHSILESWAADSIPLTWQDAVYARLRGNLNRAAADQIASMLQLPTIPRPTDLLNLLLEAPLQEVRHVLLAFAREESNSAKERGLVAERLLLLEGRAALAELLPAIRPDAQPAFLRRLFSGWRTCLTQEDLPLLKQLATEAEGFVAQFALQLWAIHERDSDARLEIYQIARQADTSYRASAMAALARGGKDEAITQALLAELNAGGRDARSLARRLIPQFANEQVLLDAYFAHAAGMSLSQRGQWMSDLARMTLPEGPREAMRWLVEGGWSTGNQARSVVRYLSRSEEVDPLLPTLLSIGKLPQYIRFPLALARGPYSEDARAYLRFALPDLMPSEQGLVLQMLAANGELEDLLLIRDYAANRSRPTSARLEAMRSLVGIPEAHDLLGQWREPMPQDYQVLATLIELLLLSDQEEWRTWALETAMSPPASFDQDEARGLRTELWRVLGQRCAPGDLERLSLAIATQLTTLKTRTAPDEGWNSLYRFESDYPELAMALASYVRCSRTIFGGGSPSGSSQPTTLVLPEDFRSKAVAADVLVIAASYLAEVAPETAAAWFADLATRPLRPEDHLRVAGLSACRLPYGPASQSALKQLLADPPSLRQNPRVIAQSFAPVGLGWVLIHDRLAEQLLLSEVLQQQRPLQDLQVLLDGWVEDDVLATAATFAADIASPESLQLSLQLQHRRTVHLPLSAEIHGVVAVLAEQLGEQELARKEHAIVRRLTPQDWTESR
jgi:hypothetical protein